MITQTSTSKEVALSNTESESYVFQNKSHKHTNQIKLLDNPQKNALSKTSQTENNATYISTFPKSV